DANNDGVADAQVAEVEGKVAEAEKAEKAAEDALAEANKDGLISKEEADKLKGLNDAVVAAKGEAQKAVDALPENGVKDGFQARLDKVDG
ncbi:GA-like domain-containing protein, partial [Escherichia coli]|uniref:GA-like domain-containing protein n=1 Tax=Escherichia coli TaxID=562 RepID=UPI00390602AF|nr:hypothetical protein [Escherichia coli]